MTRSSRRLKKQASEDGAVGGQSSETSEGLPGSQAKHATLQKGNRSEPISYTDYENLFYSLTADMNLNSRPNTPSELQPDPSSEDEEFSFPKRTAKTSAPISPTPVDLRNSFSALSDNEEEEQDDAHATIRPTYKDKMPPIFLKHTPS